MRSRGPMAEFLVFTLAARMASMGDLAGHERRGTGLWPARSALIGLIGAALGVRRSDREGQDALRRLRFAVAAHDTGTPLRDYHTVQTVPQKFKRPATRADALRVAKDAHGLNTTITLRDYRSGVVYAVAAWDAPRPLSEIAEALIRPAFTLYFGRKSCPLSLPVAPEVVEADDPAEALARRAPPEILADAGKEGKPQFIVSDPWPGLDCRRVEARYDDPVDRDLWHFAAREVLILGEGDA